MNSQQQKMKQQQKLTPQQLNLMRMLQMPVTTLEQKIKDELEKNPMLDSIQVQDENAEQNEINEQNDSYDSPEQSDFKGTDNEEYYEDDDYSYRERMERDRNVEERRLDPSEGTSFTESLLRQMSLQPLSERQKTICNEIIGSIDGSGYLGRDLQMIANDMAFRSGLEVSDSEMEEMLAVIQSFDPAGVGARNLRECLSLQLARRGATDPDSQNAANIVENYFTQLSNKHYASIMTALKIDEATLNRALGVIRRLNPKPGWGRDDEHKGAEYIIPDFIVSRDGGIISFTLSSRNSPQLQLNSDYTAMLQDLETRKSLNSEERSTMQFIRSKSDEAMNLIETLRQREQTLSATMAAIVKKQTDFFLSGNRRDLKPMRLKDIAEATGFDESTISRVVNEKYVQCDFGTLLLKELFTKAVVTEQGDVMAVEHIKEALKKAIDEEDKGAPLTDEQLTQLLKEKGFNLSRRTVSKYREAMDIPVGRLRKELKNKA